jgi:hypothetical protein
MENAKIVSYKNFIITTRFAREDGENGVRNLDCFNQNLHLL